MTDAVNFIENYGDFQQGFLYCKQYQTSNLSDIKFFRHQKFSDVSNV